MASRHTQRALTTIVTDRPVCWDHSSESGTATHAPGAVTYGAAAPGSSTSSCPRPRCRSRASRVWSCRPGRACLESRRTVCLVVARRVLRQRDGRRCGARLRTIAPGIRKRRRRQDRGRANDRGSADAELLQCVAAVHRSILRGWVSDRMVALVWGIWWETGTSARTRALVIRRRRNRPPQRSGCPGTAASWGCRSPG